MRVSVGRKKPCGGPTLSSEVAFGSCLCENAKALKRDRRSYLSKTVVTPKLVSAFRGLANPTLRSARDAIDSCVALDTAQRCVELLDIVARQQLANAGRRVEGFRQTDFAGIGE